LLERVGAHLQAMPPAERQRWRDLLHYIGAMIYHERNENEQSKLQEALEQSMRSEELRQEVIEMGKSMADVLMERGERKGRTEGRTEAAIKTRQETLVRQLRKRFGDVPRGVVRAVQATTDVAQLDDWLDRFATADTLDDLGIPAAR